jgi:hypothetical protein
MFFKTGWTIRPQCAEVRILTINEFKRAFLDQRAKDGLAEVTRRLKSHLRTNEPTAYGIFKYISEDAFQQVLKHANRRSVMVGGIKLKMWHLKAAIACVFAQGILRVKREYCYVLLTHILKEIGAEEAAAAILPETLLHEVIKRLYAYVRAHFAVRGGACTFRALPRRQCRRFSCCNRVRACVCVCVWPRFACARALLHVRARVGTIQTSCRTRHAGTSLHWFTTSFALPSKRLPMCSSPSTS